MKRLLIMSAVGVLSFVFGAACVYLLMKPHAPANADEWISVESNSEGLMYDLGTAGAGIPFPKTHKPTGRIKFLIRDTGVQVGYVLKFPIDPDPTSKFPAKYLRKLKTESGEELGPPYSCSFTGISNSPLRMRTASCS